MHVKTPFKPLASLLLAGAAIAAPLSAHAEWTPSANVALTTDYVFRGVSQSDENAAIQGGFDLSHDSGFYLGTWASNVDFNETDPDTDEPLPDQADMELDVYLGYAGEAGDISYDIGLLRYIYPGTTADLDYNELVVSAGYMGATFLIGYSNDVFATSETGIYYNLSYEHEIMEGLTAAAGVGYYDFDSSLGSPDSYVDYHVGAAMDFAGFGFDLSYYDTNGDGNDIFGDIADGRVVFTISKEM